MQKKAFRPMKKPEFPGISLLRRPASGRECDSQKANINIKAITKFSDFFRLNQDLVLTGCLFFFVKNASFDLREKQIDLLRPELEI